jgi:hypothetical protein
VVVAQEVQRAVHQQVRPVIVQRLVLFCCFPARDRATDDDVAQKLRALGRLRFAARSE